MRHLLLLPFAAFALAACQTTEDVTDAAADGADQAADATERVARGAADTAEDAAQAGADVAEDAYGTVTDAAGDTWDAVTDLFDDDDASGGMAADAAALVRPTTAPGASVEGTVRFYYMDDDLRADVSLRGLEPGAHGMHLHQYPNCAPEDTDDDGMMEPAGAAGGHWDPLNTNDHGAATEERDDKHLGDLGNITAGADGTVETTVTVEGFMPGEYPVSGHAVVIHGGRDDLETDPAGDSGTPQGCGEIEARM